MAADSLIRLYFESSALGTVRPEASSLRANIEHERLMLHRYNLSEIIKHTVTRLIVYN